MQAAAAEPSDRGRPRLLEVGEAEGGGVLRAVAEVVKLDEAARA